RLFDVSRRAREGRAGPGFSKHVAVSPSGRRLHADHHGRSRHRHRAVSRVLARSTINRCERKELAPFRITTRALQLFLSRRARENEERWVSDKTRVRMV